MALSRRFSRAFRALPSRRTSIAKVIWPSAAVAAHSNGGSAPRVISPPSAIRASCSSSYGLLIAVYGLPAMRQQFADAAGRSRGWCAEGGGAGDVAIALDDRSKSVALAPCTKPKTGLALGVPVAGSSLASH